MTSSAQKRARTVCRLSLLILLPTCAICLPGPAAAQDRPKQPEKKPGDTSEPQLTFTFKRASVQAFLAYLSKAGGFQFITESAVTGDITAVAAKPITPDQALEVLRAWLLPKERTLLRTGKVVRIVTLEEAKRRGLPVRVGSEPSQIADNDELVTQVMPLRYVQATDVKQQLESLLSDKGTLMLEPTSNSLVVRDVSSNIRRFAEVLKALDQAVTSALNVKVYKLENADAEEVSKVISELFSGSGATASRGNTRGRGRRGRGGRGGFRNMARMFFGGGRGGGGSTGRGGASAQPVQVSTDTRTNSVVVTATEDQIKLIDSLVKELDKEPSSIVTEIKPYRLANADAADLAQTLTSLFEEDQQQARGRGRGRQQQQQVPRFIRRMMGSDGETETSNKDAPKPKFTTDERTNTLIVSATTTDQKVIGQLVSQLDKDPTESSSVLVMPLKHGTASNLATILTNALQDQGSGGNTRNTRNNRNNRNNRNRNRNTRNTNSSTSGLGGLVGEVTVTADEESNSLLFTTSPRNFKQIRAIVAGLDRERREVFIECLIAEVQLTDRGELGIQWNAAFTNSIENDEDGTQSLGTDFGLDALTDGLRYTTTSDKLTGLLRALKTEGRLNILSSPKILVLENQDAEISVGQEVPYVTNSRITNNGDTVNTIQYRDVGIILRVTPAVNDDGYVKMTVHPEVSSIAPDAESVQISEGVRSPTFNKNFADTTIVIKTGETAVIGGLIRDSFSETVFKIPVLGDIPILGRIFGSTTREKVKQEIVVFLTPRVVQNAGQLRNTSRRVLNQYAMVPPQVLEMKLETWLRDLEEESHPYHYNKGTVLLESGRVREAITELRAAVKLKPADCASRLNLGLGFALAGKLVDAEVELRKAELLDKSDPEIPYNLAAVLWRRGDYPRAVIKLRRALEIDPTHEASKRWLPRAAARVKQLEAELLRRTSLKSKTPSATPAKKK